MQPSDHKKTHASDYGKGSLFSADMLWIVWLPVVLITLLHYATGAHHHWAHDVLRRMYYLPILFAAFSRGVRGGLAVSVVATMAYAPHAFFVMHPSQDPGTTLNKFLEIVLYNAIGLLAGLLADREARRRYQAEQAYEEQRQMAAQLVRAGRLAALGELVAGIAHEIKNPLHTIKGTAEIVDDIIPKEAEQAAMWSLLRQEVERLERISERFLSFARPLKPDLKLIPFETVFDRIRELVTAHVHQSIGVTLRVQELPRNIASKSLRADRDQLAQLVLNITSNALKAMEGEGILEVRGDELADDQGGWLLVELRNDGPVIPESDLERIFDPFCTRSQDGTGLGLAISERIAEEHGGYLEVANTGKSRGVSFTLLLPLADDEVN